MNSGTEEEKTEAQKDEVKVDAQAERMSSTWSRFSSSSSTLFRVSNALSKNSLKSSRLGIRHLQTCFSLPEMKFFFNE